MNAGQEGNQVRQYKQNLCAAAKSNDGVLIKSFLDDRLLHLDMVLNGQKQNLLHMACIGGSLEVLEMMLEYQKASKRLEARDCQQRTPMHYAAAMGYVAVVNKLLSAQAAIDPQDDSGATPLLLAVRFEWAEAARVLLEAGANPMIEDYTGHNAVDVALSKEGEVAELLSGFQGQRRQTTLLQSLRNLVFPSIKLKPVPHLKEREEERRQSAPVAPIFFDDIVGEHVPPTEAEMPSGVQTGRPEQVHSALDEALKQKKDDSAIVLDVVEPKLVNKAAGVSRLEMVFGEEVKRLEFEVAWTKGSCGVGAVKPGGHASRRGLVQGDQIVEIAGVSTAGKGRDELLPLMKKRPLTLKVDRKTESE